MRVTGTLQVDSRHLLIDGVLTSSSLRQGFGGLVAEFTQGHPVILTGINMGPVRMTVEPLPQAPDELEAGWEDVAEFSAMVRAGEPVIIRGPLETAPVDFPDLSAHRGKGLRVRVHARGRDTAPDLAVADAVEEYLVLAWPELTATTPIVLAAGSRAAADWQLAFSSRIGW